MGKDPSSVNCSWFELISGRFFKVATIWTLGTTTGNWGTKTEQDKNEWNYRWTMSVFYSIHTSCCNRHQGANLVSSSVCKAPGFYHWFFLSSQPNICHLNQNKNCWGNNLDGKNQQLGWLEDSGAKTNNKWMAKNLNQTLHLFMTSPVKRPAYEVLSPTTRVRHEHGGAATVGLSSSLGEGHGLHRRRNSSTAVAFPAAPLWANRGHQKRP